MPPVAIQINETDDPILGKCVYIQNSLLRIVVSISYGPRILSLGFTGEENIFWYDSGLTRKTAAAEMAEAYGPGACFYEYGGHRLWAAPPRMPETYYPDNDPVTYTIRPEGVLFTPPPQRCNGLQTSLELVLSPEAPNLMVIHSAENLGKEKSHLALWPITMLRPGGTVVLPQNNEEADGNLPDRVLTLWPGSNICDPRLTLGNRYILIRHAALPGEHPLILGTNNTSGWLAYALEGTVLVKRYVHNPNISYPNHNCSCRVYAGDSFVQLESISPMYGLEPGQAIRHVENFTLYHSDALPQNPKESAIQSFIDNLR